MEEIEIVAGGGKGTKRQGYPTEIPPLALLEVAKVMKEGADKYGAKNWHGNAVNDELDHALTHLYLYLVIGNIDELSHAAARVLMALDHTLRAKLVEHTPPASSSRPPCVPALGEQL